MPMDFKGAANRVRSLIAAKKPQDLSRSALTPDALRDNIIAEEGSRSERFRAASQKQPVIDWEREDENGVKSQEQYPWTQFGECLRDVARAQFSYDEPQVLRREQVRPSAQLNREVVQGFLASDESQEAYPYTRGNPTESLFASLAASKSLEASARERLAEHIARSNEMEQAEDDQASAEEMLERLRERARQQKQDSGQIDPNVAPQVRDQVARREAAKAALAQLQQQQQTSSMVRAARAAGKAAAHEANEAAQVIHSLPGMDPGQARNLSPEQQIALAEKWSENGNMRHIARMVGRLVRDMRFKRQARTKNVPVEPVDITTGRHLDRMLPHELARAYMPELRPLWMKDYSEHALLEWEMSGTEPAGKGPIVCVHDGSGSMSGEKFVWATSLGLALLTIAQREKRDYAGVEFGSRTELKSWIFPSGAQPDPDEVVDYAGHFFGGGTDIGIGLAEALRIITDVPQFKTADVVLLTDGIAHYGARDKAAVDALVKLGVRIHGIAIEAPHNAYLDQACEWWCNVEDLAGTNEATDQLAEQIT